MKTTLEVLREARRLVAEVGWTQGALARDQAGMPVAPDDETACAFCLIGAIERAGGRAASRPVMRAKRVLDDLITLGSPVFTVGQWNDRNYRARHDVLNAFDRAIESRPAVLGAKLGEAGAP